MTSSGARILYLCSSWPRGKSFGGQIRSLHVGRALQQVGEVTVLVVSADADDQEAQRLTAEEFPTLPPIKPQLSPNRGWWQKLRWAFDPTYMNLHGFLASPADRERVMAILGDYDLVWIFNSRTANILQLWQSPHTHLDIDDVPSTYLRGVEARERSLMRRWRTRLQRVLWHRRELKFRQRFRSLSVCSEADRVYLGGGDNIHVIPNGFERPALIPVYRPSSKPLIGFMGLFNYAPNFEGVQWFIANCWESIQRRVPEVRLRLVGTDTDGPSQPRVAGVDGLGWIKDPSAEVASWTLMIVPIQTGGGTRIKIVDAFSRKCPVVSTTFGAFGYEVQNGAQLLLADTAEDFATACVELLEDRVKAGRLAEAAWQTFDRRWTWSSIAPKINEAARACMRRV